MSRGVHILAACALVLAGCARYEPLLESWGEIRDGGVPVDYEDGGDRSDIPGEEIVFFDDGGDEGGNEDGGESNCSGPLSGWNVYTTTFDRNVAGTARAREGMETWILTSSGGYPEERTVSLYRFQIDNGTPSATPVTIDVSGAAHKSPAGAARRGDRIAFFCPPNHYPGTEGPAEAFLINTEGNVLSRSILEFIPIGWLPRCDDGLTAMTGDRIAIAIGDGDGNVLVEIRDYSLRRITGFNLEDHSFHALRAVEGAFQIAVINPVSQFLEVFWINDSGLGELITTYLVGRPRNVTWAGDKVVVEDANRECLVILTLDGGEQTVSLPAAVEGWGFSCLTTAESPLGLVLGLQTRNIVRLGLVRQDDTVEWKDAPGRSLHPMPHADGTNIGIFYNESYHQGSGSALEYHGFWCNPNGR